jgi:hypothetical protein
MKTGVERRLLLLTVGLLLLLAGFNYYYLKPRLTWKIPSGQPLPSLEELPAVRPSDRVESTLSLIRKLAGHQPALQNIAPRTSSRNPFLDPKGDEAKPATGNNPKTTAQPPPQVQMVAIGEQQRSALVNNRLVQEGELLHGRRILKIVPAGVWIKMENGPRLLPLGSYVEARQQARQQEAKEQADNQKERTSPEELRRQSIRQLFQQLEPILAPHPPGKSPPESEKKGHRQ